MRAGVNNGDDAVWLALSSRSAALLSNPADKVGSFTALARRNSVIACLRRYSRATMSAFPRAAPRLQYDALMERFVPAGSTKVIKAAQNGRIEGHGCTGMVQKCTLDGRTVHPRRRLSNNSDWAKGAIAQGWEARGSGRFLFLGRVSLVGVRNQESPDPFSRYEAGDVLFHLPDVGRCGSAHGAVCILRLQRVFERQEIASASGAARGQSGAAPQVA